MGLGLARDPRAARHRRRRASPRSSRSSAARAAPIVDFDVLPLAQFLGANIVAFMVSFAMLAMFFFLALYMQNILGYSAARGRRALPALDALIIVAGPLAGRL